MAVSVVNVNVVSVDTHVLFSPPARRTLADIREEVAQGLALRAIAKAKIIDGVRVGVYFTFAKKQDEEFLQSVAEHIHARLHGGRHLFAVATTGAGTHTLVITGSDADEVQRAVLLTSSKFVGRIESVTNDGSRLVAAVRDLGNTSYDEAALWDVVTKSARAPLDPLVPPPGSRSIDRILSDARAQLQRVTPAEAYAALHDTALPMPVFLVDIRPAAQRAREGGIDGSLIIERNVLEWRFDPRCEARLAIADRYDLQVIVYCQEGYTSSLAALALRELGLLNATDMIGGYAAWREAGLPGQIRPPSTVSASESWALSQSAVSS
ncbi:Rhodanese-like domain-containing protein [Hygrophoropsis aurantiaca]|uniref:Rhodanese-like domain-containing protein n=1 Tax=Hygrophoropsis aurantiaca TaxID=72124 RepID=A0ACB7ZW82_9AGAM|nr:Rhodanese-like domain-containing protein [Hygrophoropsis aurantiaca]